MEGSKEVSIKDNDIQETIATDDSSPKKKKLTEHAIFQIIGLLIPVLYLFGYLYSQGYFSAYGVSLSIFPQSTDHYFVSLFLMISEPVFTNTEKFFWVVVAIFILLSLLAVFNYFSSLLTDKLISRLEKKNILKQIKKPSKALSETLVLIEKSFLIIIITASSMIAIMLLALFGITAYSQGINLAQKQKEAFQGCNIETLSINKSCDFLLDNNKVKYKGILFGKSETHYGIWDGEKTHVVPIKDLILEVRYGEKE